MWDFLSAEVAGLGDEPGLDGDSALQLLALKVDAAPLLMVPNPSLGRKTTIHRRSDLRKTASRVVQA